MVISKIRSDIQSIRDNTGLFNPLSFSKRADALDFIDFHVINRIETLIEQRGAHQDLDLLMLQAKTLQQELEGINAGLFKEIKNRIVKGEYRGEEFIKMIRLYTGYVPASAERSDRAEYDNLDLFINGILLQDDLPEPDTELEPGMVFYQQTPAGVIFDLSRAINANGKTTFYDLGSGLGHVAILMHLIKGIKCVGVEYVPAYCNYAKGIASKLNLTEVEFINSDVLNLNYHDATVLFLYSPFTGQIMQKALEILRSRSSDIPLQIFSYGPCSIAISEQQWLVCKDGPVDNINRLYQFLSR